MNEHKKRFLELAIKVNALKFGDFTLKSGRKSPYFFNAGAFNTGTALFHLGDLYARTLLDNEIPCDHLFGPAYKGIPLATTTAIALHQYGYTISLVFNRKEIKQHGEGGQLFGASITGNTVIIDDVISAGTAFREAQNLINETDASLSGVVIALDRCEKGLGQTSALEDIRTLGINVASVATLHDLLEYLQGLHRHKEIKAIETYLQEYGV